MTYEETLHYLYTSIPVFQNAGPSAYKPGLGTSIALDDHLGNPHKAYKTIHVAGTNGKGSVSHLLAAILRQSGYKVGLYTSPHLVDFRERIRVNGQKIPKEYVVDFVERNRSFFEPLQPSFFELTSSMAFDYFRAEKVDYAVIEVGMGGRLDCTNIITPDLSVITNISFDHVQFLGDTLTKIAGEKAGIIKPGVPVVIGETTEETKKVFKDKSLEMNAPIRFAEEEHEVISSRSEGNTRVYETLHYGSFIGELGGLCQEKNTATILTAIDELRKAGYTIAQEHIRIGFGQVCKLTGLRGRWQQVGMSPTIICDTGHNTGGISYIADQLRGIQADKLHIVIGMVNDKDIHSVLRQLPQCATYYFTKANVKRALDEHTLQTLAKEAGLRGTSWPDVRSAFQAARQSSTKKDLIFVGGSTFIVADFLAFYHPEQA